MNAFPYEKLNTNINALYRHTSKRHAMRTDEMVFRLDQRHTNASFMSSCKKKFTTSISTIVFYEKAFCTEKNGNYLVRSSWYVSFRDIRSELSLGNNLSPESGSVRRIFEIFSSHAVRVLLDLVIETLVQLGQPYASYEVVVAFS